VHISLLFFLWREFASSDFFSNSTVTLSSKKMTTMMMRASPPPRTTETTRRGKIGFLSAHFRRKRLYHYSSLLRSKASSSSSPFGVVLHPLNDKETLVAVVESMVEATMASARLAKEVDENRDVFLDVVERKEDQSLVTVVARRRPRGKEREEAKPSSARLPLPPRQRLPFRYPETTSARCSRSGDFGVPMPRSLR
jgi:hypothetical protein